MIKKIYDLIFPALTFILGVLIVIAPKPKISRWSSLAEYEVDLTSIKWIVGPALAIHGLFFFIKIYKRPIAPKKIYYKCISCGIIVELEEGSDNFCADCKNPLEKLEGFFERHPEFKDQKDNAGS